MLRLLSRGRKADASGEDEPKQYKKANLGLANQMYYNEELKMWVERGKEEEAKAEKAKLSTPPPSVGSMSAASSATSLSTAAEVTSGPGTGPVTFSRDRSLKGRYIATPLGGAAAPAASGSSSGPPSGSKSLLPGGAAIPGVPRIPGKPAIPGAGPMLPGLPPSGSFFMPTATASDAASNAAGDSSTPGTMSLSQSGTSMDAFMAGSKSNSQPPLFMPGQPAGGNSVADSATVSTPAAEAVDSSAGVEEDGTAGDERRSQDRDSSAGGRLPALADSGNLSFAMWQPPVPKSFHQEQQLEQSAQQQQRSEGEPEVTSPAQANKHQQHQQHGEQQLPYPAANGNHGTYSHGGYTSNFPPVDPEGAAGTSTDGFDGEPAAGQEHKDHSSSNAWDSQPARDPFNMPLGPEAGAGAAVPGWGGGDDGGEGGGYSSNWGVHQPAQDPFGGPHQDPFGAPQQDPFGAPQQDPFGAPQQDPFTVGTQQPDAAAQGGWETGVEAGGGWGGEGGYWGEGAAAGAGAGAGGQEAAADGAVQPAAAGDAQKQAVSEADVAAGNSGAYGQYAGWGQTWDAATHQGYGTYPGQQQQQQSYDAAANGVYQPTDYGSAQAPQSGDAGQQQQQQQYYDYGYSGVNGYYGNDGSSYSQQQPDMVTTAGAADGQQQAAVAATGAEDGQQYQEQQQQQMPVLLDPVHPELPGIATTVGSAASDDLAPLSSSKQMHHSLNAAAAAARHQSAPGSAPHPAGYGTGSSAAQLGGAVMPSTVPARSNSMHTAGMGGNSLNSLLPPARPSFNGSSNSIGSSPQKESSALTVPPTAIAGDASMLTAVRPSSPYARPVSPLARTNTGVSDHSTNNGSNKAAQQGFPIPSPPTAMLAGKPGVFIPAGSNFQQQQQPVLPGQPWRPGSTAGLDVAGAAAGAAAAAVAGSLGPNVQQQQQAGFGPPMLLNGYTGSFSPSPPHAAAPDSTLDDTGGADASAKSVDRRFSQSAAAYMPTGVPGSATRSQDSSRSHPYDSLVNEELQRINWDGVPWVGGNELGKLPGVTHDPYRKHRLEQAQKKEQEQQEKQRKEGSASKSKKDAFWYKQMEHRKKLPAAAMKPSVSEPNMPTHWPAANGAAPASPGDSSVSQLSNYTDWQQHYQQQQQQQPGWQGAPASSQPCTPVRAATVGGTYAVAGASPGEEPTPTSKFVPLADARSPAAAIEHAAAVVAEVQQHVTGYAAHDQQQQQQQEAAAGGGYQQTAAAATVEDGSSWQAQQPSQEQQYAQYYADGQQYGTGEQSQVDAQYYTNNEQYNQQYYQQYYQQYGYPQDSQQQGQGQQQEQQQPYQQQEHQQLDLQQQPAADGQAEQPPQQEVLQQQHPANDLQQQQLDGWGSEQSLAVGVQLQDSHHTAPVDPAVPVAIAGSGEAAPAAADAAWGNGEAGVGAQQLDAATAAAVDAAGDGWEADAGAFDALVVPDDGGAAEWGAGDWGAAAAAAETADHGPRIARLSSSGSQPSTAKVAAAAAKHIVSQALGNIVRDHEENAAGDVDGAAALDAEAAAAAVGTVDIAAEVPEAAGAAAVELAEAAAGDADAQAAYSMPVLFTAHNTDWSRLRRRLVEVGSTWEGDLALYKDYFLQYGDHLLPYMADSGDEQQQQQQGIEQAAAAAAEVAAMQEQMDQLFEAFGQMQMKAEVSDSTFLAQGLDVEAVLSSLAV